MSLKTPKAVYTASERQYTAAGEIQVPQSLAMLFTSYGNRNKGIILGFRKQTQFYVSFVAP